MDAAPATRPLSAAGSVIAAMALIGLIDNFVAGVARTHGVWQFHLLRSLVALALIWGAARLSGRSLRPMRAVAVLGRSVFVVVSMVFYFGSLGFLPVAQVAAGLFTAPIFVMLFTALVLRERVSMAGGVAVLIGFAGILLVLRPDARSLGPATLAPVAAGAFYAIGGVTTRRWCAREDALTLLAAFFVIMTMVGAAGCVVLALWAPDVPAGADGFVLRGWRPVTDAFLAVVVAQAAGSVAGVWLLTRGYLLGEASYVAGFEYVFLIFAGIWGYLLWGQLLDATSMAGIALIIGSGGLLARNAH